MKTFASFDIQVPAGAIGNVKTKCPACKNDRKKNKNDKPLSVNIADGIWNCHNCGYSGTLFEREKKAYIRPTPITQTASEKAAKWFEGRKLTAETLNRFGIVEKREWMPQLNAEANCVVFPYVKNGEVINYKFRDGQKNFKLVKDAELCIFNYDGVKGKKTAIITEGEIDAMSVFQAGVCLTGEIGVCSVPNGASKGNQKLEYLDNSWQAFNDCEKIIIATDNDDAGIALKAELSRRLGKYRCFDIFYPEGCKDFNEVLVKHGPNGIVDCLNGSKPMPIEGIHRLTDFDEEIEYVYENGFESGATVGYYEFDKHVNFGVGQVTILTGVPGSGKSTFLDQLLIRLSNRNGWKHGICSFEKQPITKHIVHLSQCYIGQPFYRPNPHEKMGRPEKDKAKIFLNDSFFWFKVRNADVSVDGILTRAIHLVKAFGINSLVIDPYNYIENNRKAAQTETEYVSEVLTKLCDFAKDYGVHVFLVAHPVKMNKGADGEFEVPNLYKIAGSHNFYSKPDIGIVVHRNRKDGTVVVYIQKVRYEPENGQLGSVGFLLDRETGRYREEGEPNFIQEYRWEKQPEQIALPFEPAPHKIFNASRHVTDNDDLPF